MIVRQGSVAANRISQSLFEIPVPLLNPFLEIFGNPGIKLQQVVLLARVVFQIKEHGPPVIFL